jgi:hypothetical protein
MRNVSAFQPKGTTKSYHTLNGSSVDFSGNGNTGTDTSITYPQGRFGQGAKFNGSSSKITVADSASLDLGTGNFTVAFFMKGGSQTDYTGLVCKAPTGATWAGFQIMVLTNKIYVEFTNSVAGHFTCNTLINNNQWNSVVMTRFGTTSTVYVNGRYDGALTNEVIGSSVDNAVALLIGVERTPSIFFNGLIDEVIIESRVWSAKEVETYYRKSMLNYKQSFFAKLLQAFSITDTLSLTESITNLRGRNFSNTDTLSLSEVITALKGIAFTVSDTLHLTEAFTATRTFLFNVVDTLGLTDLTDFIFKWNKVNKPSSSWDKSTKPSTTFINTSKGSSTWTKKNKS